jgi:hypothetical protein
MQQCTRFIIAILYHSVHSVPCLPFFFTKFGTMLRLAQHICASLQGRPKLFGARGKVFFWEFFGSPFHSLKFLFGGHIKPGNRGQLSPLPPPSWPALPVCTIPNMLWPCIRLEKFKGEFWYVSDFFHLAQLPLARQQGQGKYFLDVNVNSHHVHNILVHYINANFPSNY